VNSTLKPVSLLVKRGAFTLVDWYTTRLYTFPTYCLDHGIEERASRHVNEIQLKDCRGGERYLRVDGGRRCYKNLLKI